MEDAETIDRIVYSRPQIIENSFLYHLKENTRKRVRDANPITLDESIHPQTRLGCRVTIA